MVWVSKKRVEYRHSVICNVLISRIFVVVNKVWNILFNLIDAVYLIIKIFWSLYDLVTCEEKCCFTVTRPSIGVRSMIEEELHHPGTSN